MPYGTAGNLYGCYAPNGQAYYGNIKTDAKPHVRAVVFDNPQPGSPTDAVMHCRVDSAEMKMVYRCCESSMKIGDFRTANTTAVPWSGDGTLAEVLVYDRPLEAAELEQLESTLKAATASRRSAALATARASARGAYRQALQCIDMNVVSLARLAVLAPRQQKRHDCLSAAGALPIH